ncbi:MAG TPA: DHA2 family efflux MFS transporter permease subunit [Acidimicrobiales bacterium]|nr:DHA2 family efflux MFS transporter permease subunit [Acidimicrobiales bacterium]
MDKRSSTAGADRSAATGRRVSPAGAATTGRRVSPAGAATTGRRVTPAGAATTGRRVTPAVAAAVAYVTSMFLGAIDTHIVNVALPALSHDFGAPLSSVQWTVTGYVLSLAVWIPASGWLGDRFGTKRLFLVALTIFTLASALSGQARNLGELIAARALQGTGGGMLLPVAASMVWRAYPPDRRAQVARIMMLPILVAPAAAPAIGGILVDHASWRWVFYINLPFGIAGVAFAWRYLAEHVENPKGRFDLAGLVLSGVGLSALLYVISEGSVEGWTSPGILAAAVVGIGCSTVFVVHSMRPRESPLLKLSLLSDRIFRATNIVFAASTASFFGLLYLTPIFLQEGMHQTAIDSGLTTFVEAIGVVVSTQTLGRLYVRLGPRRMAAAGLLGMAALAVLMSRLEPGTSLWTVRVIMFFAGAANACVFLPCQTAMFATTDHSDMSHATAIYSTQRQSAVAIGVAVMSSVAAGSTGYGSLAGFHRAFLAAAVIALAGAAGGLSLIHDRDAAATMVRRTGEVTELVAEAD